MRSNARKMADKKYFAKKYKEYKIKYSFVRILRTDLEQLKNLAKAEKIPLIKLINNLIEFYCKSKNIES